MLARLEGPTFRQGGAFAYLVLTFSGAFWYSPRGRYLFLSWRLESSVLADGAFAYLRYDGRSDVGRGVEEAALL